MSWLNSPFYSPSICGCGMWVSQLKSYQIPNIAAILPIAIKTLLKCLPLGLFRSLSTANTPNSCKMGPGGSLQGV